MILVDPDKIRHGVVPVSPAGRVAGGARGAVGPVPTLIPDTLTSTISTIDQEMKDILFDKSIDDYTKVLQYSQSLQRYLNLADQYRQRTLGNTNIKESTPVTERPSQKETKEEEEEDPLKLVLSKTIPKRLKPKADLLIDYFKKTPEISWDEKKQLVINKKTIQNSNVIDLVNDLVRVRKTSTPPTGWTELSDVLKRSNIPRELIGNTTRWSSMTQQSKHPKRNQQQQHKKQQQHWETLKR